MPKEIKPTARRDVPTIGDPDERKPIEIAIDALRSIKDHAKEFGSIEDPETMVCRMEAKAEQALAELRGLRIG